MLFWVKPVFRSITCCPLDAQRVYIKGVLYSIQPDNKKEHFAEN